MKVASLVTGILSLLFCFIPAMGLILGIVAVGTSKSSEKIEGMAAAGMVCGIIGICIGVITLGVTGCTMCVAMG